MTEPACRFCSAPLRVSFANLGMQPPSNSYVKPQDANRMEKFYPLHAYVCEQCKLVQLEEFETPDEIFSDYLYFSSYSDSWLQHAKAYAQKMIGRFGLDASSKVVEIASNDGYLLRWFVERGVPVLGVEPAANVAEVARKIGVPSEVAFFGRATAERLKAEGHAADLTAANNVLAHVPDINDFVEGFRVLLKPHGVATFEFPHLLRLIEHNQFDTIYHEHFSYISFLTAERIFAAHGLTLYDVEELPTHGGSLRLYARHAANDALAVTPAVERMKEMERAAGLDDLDVYRRFAAKVVDTKCAVLDFFLRARREGKRVAGYGAPAKGNTLLNYCGVGPELLSFTVDRSPYKQNMLLPGVHIPVLAPEAIFEEKPAYVLILPWNLRDEIVEKMSGIRAWGGKFVLPIPEVMVLP